MPAMKKSFKWILAAFVIVAGIFFVSNGYLTNLLPDSEGRASLIFIEPDRPNGPDVGVLEEGEGEDGERAEGEGRVSVEDVALEISVPKRDDGLAYGTQSEVYRFTLDADAPYSLRYLSFQISHAGLQTTPLSYASNWRLYKVVNGVVDYTNEVGSGEELADGILRVRLSSARGAAYLGEKGKETFALLSTVIKDREADAANEAGGTWMQVMISPAYWAWAPGWHQSAWLSLEEKYDADFVSGFPETPVLKK